MVKPEEIMEYCPNCDQTVIIYSVYEADCVFWRCSKCNELIEIDSWSEEQWFENYPDF